MAGVAAVEFVAEASVGTDKEVLLPVSFLSAPASTVLLIPDVAN